MVLSFFRGDDGVFDTIDRQVTEMLGACRHAFDLASSALVSGDDIDAIGEDVRSTDRIVNQLEEDVRRELVVHAAVQGGTDIGIVLSSLLVVKKLERVGDQCKNIFDLADQGVRITGDERAELDEDRRIVSALFAEAVEVLAARDEPAIAGYTERAEALMATYDARVNDLLGSDRPSSWGVPRAMLARYLKRIVANLDGCARVVSTPLDRSEPVDIDE
ncbi:PhoU domain-containing protein [Actinospongicola halichondriae]|uniref:PhoU domain-containing protein n=1 Tax=Actinospongicola halichondriae TaxID=3236844 RepID=UPI003D5C59B0